MINELFRKWFGLDPISCATCEVLSAQLANSERERRELLAKLLDKDKPESSSPVAEEMKPVGQQFVPWRVRQQMLEAEDRKRAELMRAKREEMNPKIEELEKELEINHAEGT
jgi:hypothetical protein